MWRRVLAGPLKRASKFGAVYLLYLSIIWLFDYVYFPWLTIRFRYLVFFPLFPSIFLASWGGYYLYRHFQEDVFFADKIYHWLERPGTGGLRGKIRSVVLNRPACVFAAVSTWWSPLHAYVFLNRDQEFRLFSFLKLLAIGSLFCALFWGFVGDSLIFSYSLLKAILR
ncbi:MAG: hypothetical protein EPN47_11915 [Acidobacteria bacterium]|nr:MAG: hypothetical protein EPN47_11915 [Acidobacteriota bacterium]